MKQQPQKWDGRGRGSTVGNWFFTVLIRAGGVYPAYALLIFVACVYTLLDRELRRIIRDFRATLGLPQSLWHVYRHIYSFGMNLIDSFAFLTMKKPPFTYRCIGEEHICEALQKGQGLILLSAHIGNWEIAGNRLFDRIDTRINLVMLDNERESIKRVFRKATDKRRITIIAVSEDGFDMMIKVRNALASNEIVCFLGDRVRGAEESRELPFFGREARFPVGPFVVAALTGAPIIAVCTLKNGFRRYVHKAYASITFDGMTSKNRNEKIEEGMRTYVSVLEDIVEHNPCQWYNYYLFWDE